MSHFAPSSPLPIGIIGAGIVGVSCGIHLQRSGERLEIIDSSGPGEGASAGNAGIIAVSELIPLSTMATLRKVPAMLRDANGPLRVRPAYLPTILPWLIRFTLACRPVKQRATIAALVSMLSHSWEAWSDFARHADVAALIARSGWLQVFQNRENLLGKASTVVLQRRNGVDVRELTAAEVQAIEPALSPIFAGGLYYPGNGLVSNPRGMVRVLAEMLLHGGAIFRREHVISIAAHGGDEVQVCTSAGTRRYKAIVIAAGAYSRELLRTMKVDLPLDTERGYHLMLPAPDQILRRSVSFSEYGFSLGPIENAIRLTSGVEFAGLAAPPDFAPIRHMVAHAQRFLPGLRSDVSAEWLGFRPSLPDSLPVIGRLCDHTNVILAFGHGHLGLTTGPLTGRLVAALVNDAPLPFDLGPVSPQRWGL